jgi:A/G-specific adenine glycosylase
MTFSQRLIGWYRKNKRDLPWRDTNDAYLIWLSEIILQQTRVEQGMPYYLRFVDSFPDIKSFAAASEDEILRMWQGLGYYSRGRNMLKTARKVVEEHSGKFPESYKDLIQLVGIGEYTASAISSFSSNEAKAVVDGNVYRFLSRYFGVDTPINSNAGKKEFQALADEVLDHQNAGEHNQAMIEFGALQCKPKNPDCELCLFNDSCIAFEQRKVHVLPVKLKKLKIKERFFFFFLVIKEDQILIKRRTNTDIWAGLHDLPAIEFTERTSVNELMIHPDFRAWFDHESVIYSISDEIKHILTHQRLFVHFIHIDKSKEEFVSKNGWFWIKINELDQYGKPKLIFEFLKKYLN